MNKPYFWPERPVADAPRWALLGDEYLCRAPADTKDELLHDSRWPAFMSQPICIVTVHGGGEDFVERVVGPSIVNRFPLIAALSICSQRLSARHYARTTFIDALRSAGRACIQFLPPSDQLNAVLSAISEIEDADGASRLVCSGVSFERLPNNGPAVLAGAYVAYDVAMAPSRQDMYGTTVLEAAETNVGSHTIFLTEVRRILLEKSIAAGYRQIFWNSLASWRTDIPWGAGEATSPNARFVKGYSSEYYFPGPNAPAFAGKGEWQGYAVLELPAETAAEPEPDPNKARWPCFFPSSVGLISSRSSQGVDNVTPCGSTAVVGRFPMTFAVSMAYAEINERYSRRGCVSTILETGRFGCGVPFDEHEMIRVIRYLGNISIREEPEKVRNSGVSLASRDIAENVPVIRQLPIHFDTRIVGTIKLGTHILFLGTVERILVRRAVGPDAPMAWSPFAELVERRR